MRDLLDLRKGKEDLLFLYHGAKDLLNKVEAYACQELQHFYQSYKDENLFQPTKNQSLKSLDGWPFYALAKNRLQRCVCVCVWRYIYIYMSVSFSKRPLSVRMCVYMF